MGLASCLVFFFKPKKVVHVALSFFSDKFLFSLARLPRERDGVVALVATRGPRRPRRGRPGRRRAPFGRRGMVRLDGRPGGGARPIVVVIIDGSFLFFFLFLFVRGVDCIRSPLLCRGGIA